MVSQLLQHFNCRSQLLMQLIGNTWDVEVGFETESHLQYKYFVQVDGGDIRWEKITNRYASIFFFFFSLIFSPSFIIV